MTNFWRNGFWRTSVNGVLHWVEGHSVDRDNWERRSGGDTRAHFLGLLDSTRAGRSVTSTFVNPNADCPVCGAPVFFYQNAVGSRLCFDELGPPWPKHPCTDSALNGSHAGTGQQTRVSPQLRETEDAESIVRCLVYAGVNPLEVVYAGLGLEPWTPCSLQGTLRHGKRSIVVLRRLADDKSGPSHLYLQVKHRLAGIRDGDLLFHYKGWLSYFDVDRTEPVELEAKRLHGAAAAIEVLLGAELHRAQETPTK